ncbi:hypothetical protein ONZ43_g6178 [Nemania bipapillata]|uniref:Uncharacterized protein n=1 Tax=Nemania bipapillata TaxID=110536 RepID=A0ACC2I1N1_9PEZI|nr:hypothetical protein ONZ43_g6178 [Nemania bipapillata]
MAVLRRCCYCGIRRGGQRGGVLADRVERGEVDGRAHAGAQGRGHGAPPEGSGDGIGRADGDVADGGADRVRARLLHARLDEVERLQEHGAKDAGAQPRDEVEGWPRGKSMYMSAAALTECQS